MNLSLLPVRPGQFSSRLGPQSCHRFEYKLLCLHLCHDCFRMVRQRARGLSTTPLHDACAPTRSTQLSSYRCWQGCRVDSAVTLCRRRGIRLALCLLSCPCLSAPRHCAGSRNQHLLRVVSPWTSLRPAQSCPPVLFGVAPPISAGMYTRPSRTCRKKMVCGQLRRTFLVRHTCPCLYPCLCACPFPRPFPCPKQGEQKQQKYHWSRMHLIVSV